MREAGENRPEASGQLGRSSEPIERLIERLLGDPELRRRFAADAAGVLTEAGLPELAAGVDPRERGLLTLELRESRSSLAGVMVAAAAEGFELIQSAAHAAPALAHDAGRAMDRLVDPAKHEASPDRAGVAKPAEATTPSLGAPAAIPELASRAPAVSAPGHGIPAGRASTVSRLHPAGPGAGSIGPRGAALKTDPGSSVDAAAHPGHSDPPSSPHDHHAGKPSTAAGAAAGESPNPQLTYPGDAASPQQLAAWMAAGARQAGLPGELPVMAALTESGLRNLSYGDRDSVGFFQMRLGIWNQGAYTGYPDDPTLQLKWFIDHALAVRAEDPSLAQSPGSWGDWVADVERPAAAYRFRYQLQLGAAQELLRGAVSSPAPAPVAAPATPVPQVPVRQSALEVVLRYAGRGDGRGSQASLEPGLDSASLVAHAYAQEGIQMPRVAAEQFDVGIPVSREDLRPGDAVFFRQPGGYIDHVGLYVGDGRFVSTFGSAGDVKIAPLGDPGFAGAYAGGRRYTAGAVGDPTSYARPLPAIRR